MIEFRAVSKSYPEFDISLDITIDNGTLVSILGPSGSGKTTSLRLIAGFARPDAGQILIDGDDVTDKPPAQRGIGYVFQDYTLFPHMNVARNVSYGLRVRNVSAPQVREKVEYLLDLVELPGYGDRDVATLSGGERQRVAIARALAVDPVLLLLDEPFSSIDEVLRRELREEIVRLQQELGITVVFVTHSRQEALSISDKVAVLRQGRVIQYDTSENLYRQPCNRFVASFVGEANYVEGPTGPVMFRPEQMTLTIEGEAAPPGRSTGGDQRSMHGRIVSRQFMGHSHLYGCRRGEVTLLVMDRRRIPLGTSVSIGYDPRAGVRVDDAAQPGGEKNE